MLFSTFYAVFGVFFLFVFLFIECLRQFRLEIHFCSVSMEPRKLQMIMSRTNYLKQTLYNITCVILNRPELSNVWISIFYLYHSLTHLPNYKEEEEEMEHNYSLFKTSRLRIDQSLCHNKERQMWIHVSCIREELSNVVRRYKWFQKNICWN